MPHVISGKTEKRRKILAACQITKCKNLTPRSICRSANPGVGESPTTAGSEQASLLRNRKPSFPSFPPPPPPPLLLLVGGGGGGGVGEAVDPCTTVDIRIQALVKRAIPHWGLSSGLAEGSLPAGGLEGWKTDRQTWELQGLPASAAFHLSRWARLFRGSLWPLGLKAAPSDFSGDPLAKSKQSQAAGQQTEAGLRVNCGEERKREREGEREGERKTLQKKTPPRSQHSSPSFYSIIPIIISCSPDPSLSVSCCSSTLLICSPQPRTKEKKKEKTVPLVGPVGCCSFPVLPVGCSLARSSHELLFFLSCATGLASTPSNNLFAAIHLRNRAQTPSATTN